MSVSTLFPPVNITKQPTEMPFTEQEFADRQARVRHELERRGLRGLIVSRIEDQHWLCGFDSQGWTIFHSMFIGVDGELTHLTRSADLANIEYSSTCRDVRLFSDAYGLSRSEGIKDVLRSHGLQGTRIGLENDSFGMLPDLYAELHDTLNGWCKLIDASDLIRKLRLIKSPQEIEYMRRAGEILTAASLEAIAATVPGAYEGDLIGQFQHTVSSMDGDMCGDPNFPLGAGPRSLLVRHVSNRGHVSTNDQVTFEPGAAFRHYHVANMFTVLTGPDVNSRHIRMHDACAAALEEVQSVLRPGNTFGDVFEAHRRVFDVHGFGHAILQACGYPMGAMYSPTWMEKPVIARDEPQVIEENMTIFTHMILTDRDAGLAMTLGETVAVTQNAPLRLTPLSRSPYVNQA